jgi:hypothetical protein
LKYKGKVGKETLLLHENEVSGITVGITLDKYIFVIVCCLCSHLCFLLFCTDTIFFRSKQLIKDAIMDNDFLKNLDSSQVRELVDSMYPLEYAKGSYVIREGEAGMMLDILKGLLFLSLPTFISKTLFRVYTTELSSKSHFDCNLYTINPT